MGYENIVAAPELSAKGEAELVALAGSDLPIFVDSGAFSEVTFCPVAGRLVVVKPMTDAKWQRVLDLYKRALGMRADTPLGVAAIRSVTVGPHVGRGVAH